MYKYILLALALLIPTLASAQDTSNIMELLRSDVKLNKKEIIADNMNLNAEQSKIFWRIYNDYEYKLSKIGDKVVDNIQKFADNYDNMDEDTAEEILDNSFDNNKDKMSLLKKATKEMADKLGYPVAVRFYQIEKLLNTLIDLQVMSSIPLIESK